MTAAVVEFNSLPDAVWPAAQDDNFLSIGRRGFIFVLVSRVKIGRETFEFCRARVDALVHGQDAVLLTQMPNFFLSLQPPDACQPPVREAHALRVAQHFGWNRLDWMLLQFKLHVINFFELVEEPRIHRGHLSDLLYRVPLPQSVLDVRKALRMRRH